MKQSKQTLLALTICVASWGVNSPVFAQSTNPITKADPVKVAQTAASLRDLWISHGFWVRNVVAETIAGNTAAAAAAEKEAFANARQIATSIEPFYGKAASDSLFALLGGHYSAIKQYLNATTANSASKQDAASKALVSNGSEIAVFLSKANPNLPLETLRGLLMAHGAHHIQQIQQLNEKQYGEEAQTWEMMKVHMYGIADALADALAKQFPPKFN